MAVWGDAKTITMACVRHTLDDDYRGIVDEYISGATVLVFSAVRVDVKVFVQGCYAF